MVALVLGSIRKEDVVLSVNFKDVYFQTPTSSDCWPYLWIACQAEFTSLGCSASAFPVSQIFTRVFSVVSEWAYRQGIRLVKYLDNWLVIADSVPCLLEYWELHLSLCKDLGDSHQLGEIRSGANQQGSVSPVRRHHLGESLSNRLLDLSDSKKSHISPCEDVAASFKAKGQSQDVALQWQLKVYWSWALDDRATPVPLLDGCMQCVRWWQ